MEQTKIDRINELAWKQRTVGLTEAEAAEREQLRTEYVSSMRRSLESHLDLIRFEDEKGGVRPLKKRRP